MKNCAQCKKPLVNIRKKFCSDHCKYWFNSIKKDNEKHLPPVKKRNKNYFSMVTGLSYYGAGQGRRSGGMIKGGMSARIECTVEQMVPITKENLIRHFKGIPGFTPTYIRLGDNSIIKKENIKKEIGVSFQ